MAEAKNEVLSVRKLIIFANNMERRSFPFSNDEGRSLRQTWAQVKNILMLIFGIGLREKEGLEEYQVQYQLNNNCFMEKFKIDLFEKEYNIDFPDLKCLTNKECEDLDKQIIDKYNLHDITDFYKLIENEKPVYFIEDMFHLLSLLKGLNIKPSLQVYLNWNSFTCIDVFNLFFLDKYFFDIWYPISDDIDIFDESLNWFLSIRHDGSVILLKSGNVSDVLIER